MTAVLPAGAPAKVDADLLDSLTDPSGHLGEEKPELQAYPRDSRAYVRIDTSIRLYWHGLFDVCPKLLEVAGTYDRSLEIFRPFMAWAAETSLSLNWTFFLWVARWLKRSPEFAPLVGPDVIEELMGGSAAEWAILDRTSRVGIVLASSELPELVIGWKCRRIDSGREIETIELEVPLPPPPDGWGFFTLDTFELDHFPGWTPIPR